MNPFLSADDTFYLAYLGDKRKPFIHQTRIPLEIVIDTTAEGMALNHGVSVLCRERFNLGYGDPLRMSRYVWSTT